MECLLTQCGPYHHFWTKPNNGFKDGSILLSKGPSTNYVDKQCVEGYYSQFKIRFRRCSHYFFVIKICPIWFFSKILKRCLNTSSKKEPFFPRLCTAHWGLIQPQLSGASIWGGFFKSLNHVKISYIVIEFQNRF